MSNRGSLYTRRGIALYLIGNNSEPIKGELKCKGNNKKSWNNSGPIGKLKYEGSNKKSENNSELNIAKI